MHHHVPAPANRAALVQRAALLARVGLGWHVLEAAIAIVAGLVASSVALIGFGADSLIEVLAGVVLLWRLRTRRAGAERLAQQLIAASFVLIALYVGVEAARALSAADRPDVSVVGIVLSAFTLVTMPLLARAKTRVARQLHSSATASEARQTTICAYLSAALLLGLGANAAFGWWWADPVAALVIAGACLYEARGAWRGEACCGGPCVG
ncbi:MAG: cobalt transporter [Solirubrobacterales bacterium]|nr:cobalt transporter [Solirubrobacterales bacterium]